MKKKLLLMFALLCAVAQLAWADKWDGKTTMKPQFVSIFHSDYYGKDFNDIVVINSAAELAYIRDHWEEKSDWLGNREFCRLNYMANTDIDMGDAVSWVPMAKNNNEPFKGIFYGQGHTIRIHIWDTDDNYQGLFGGIKYGVVQDLHVSGKIECGDCRKVGGIVGLNYSGKILNCWVSADISSNWVHPGSSYKACVGGIAGDNDYTSNSSDDPRVEYCVMTGNVRNDDAAVGGIVGYKESAVVVKNCTFYGKVSSNHDQSSIFIGFNHSGLSSYKKPEKLHNEFTDSELSTYLNSFSGNDVYRYAVQYPFAVTVSTAGPGTMVSSVDRTRPGKTVKLTKKSGSAVASVIVRDADGTTIPVSGSETDGYTFTMPKRDVNVTVSFVTAEGSIPVTSETRTLEEGKTYKVIENLTISRRIEVKGSATLILGDGTTLSAKKGIDLSSEANANLTIEGPGTLVIDACAFGESGIGAKKVGTLTINGGTINVTGGYNAAAIGGDQDNTTGGRITINGGVVNAQGGIDGAGIGGGCNRNPLLGAGYGVCGDIAINGGQVTATGGSYAPGIGRGFAGMILFVENSGTLTLGWSNRDDFVYINKLTNPAGVLSSITFAQGKQFVLDGTETIATADNIEGKKIMPYATPVSLSNSADNSAAISAADGHFANVTLADRTLYRDGSWNTLCLPFNVTLSGSPFDGATARPLTSASISGTTLNLSFGAAVTELVAGTPYIIKWEGGDNIVSPVFSGVTIDKTDRSYDNGAAGDLRVRFVGTYSGLAFDTADKSILFMGGESKLRYPATGASISACRAYFKIGEDGATSNARIASFSINFGDGETTGIDHVQRSMSNVQSDIWYTPDGRRLEGKPTQRGVYIHKGKKVVIK